MIGIVGLGNILMGDDGVGVRVAERLMKLPLPPEVEVIDGGVGSLSIPFHRFKKLILIDAVESQEPPGTVLLFSKEEIMERGIDLLKLSLHGMGFDEVLSLLELWGEAPQEVFLVGVVPERVEVGMELSPEVEKAIPLASEKVLRLVERFSSKP